MNQSNNQKICVLGMGFVGLTLSVILAECGHQVIGVEINKKTVDNLNSGSAHFFETSLNSRLKTVVRNNSLVITNDINNCNECQFYIITVGTPLDANGLPRSDMVERAATEVASVMPDNAVVILRSTVRLGTTRKVVYPVLQETKKTFHLAFCPERTIEGNALAELRVLPQICGGLTNEDSWAAAQLFQSLTPTTIRVSSLETAELIKLLDNSYRDLFFAFGNEVAEICEAANMCATEVIKAGNLGYTRTNIASPGLVGGPCLEKDPHILIDGLKQYNFTPQLIASGRKLNEQVPSNVVNRLSLSLSRFKCPLKIAICGIAFKGRPETDDLRGSPSKNLINEFKNTYPDSEVVVQDFASSSSDLKSFTGCDVVDIHEAFRNSHLVVISNNNKKYEEIEIETLLETMAINGIFFDFWNVIHADAAKSSKNISCYTYGSFTSKSAIL